MELPICKCCGQTLPPTANPLRGIGLTQQQLLIASRILAAGKNGIVTSDLIDIMYRGVSNGPEFPENVLHVQKRFMREKLALAGFKITVERNGRTSATYRMAHL